MTTSSHAPESKMGFRHIVSQKGQSKPSSGFGCHSSGCHWKHIGAPQMRRSRPEELYNCVQQLLLAPLCVTGAGSLLCVSQMLHCSSTTLVPLPGLRCGQTAAGEAADSTGNQHFAALLHCCLTSPQATESHPLPRSSSRTCRSSGAG